MSYKKHKLKDLVDNFSVRARDYGGSEGLEFLGVSNDDGIVKSKSAAEHKGEEYKIIEKGCFAYNPYRINIGSIAYHSEDVKGLISPAYVVFKTKPNTIKDNLLFKFLKSAEGLRQIRFHGRGTVRQALRFEDLCKIEISIPSYEEQEILISSIENTEIESNLISSELTHQLDLIKQLRQAFLREAMQGKLCHAELVSASQETGHDLLSKIKAEKAQLIADKKLKKEKELAPISEDEIPFEIPEHWAWCRLGEIISYTENLDIHKKLSSETIINYVDIASIDNKNYLIKEVKKSTVEELSTRARRVLKKDYIIYSTVRPYLKNIAIIENELPNFIGSTGFNVFKPINSNIKYLFYFLLSPDLNKKYEETMVGFNSPSITNEQFENTLFPLPPLHGQEQIVAKLEELMAFCDGLEQSIKESQGYNEQLLQQILREALQG
jgi:type I restriction enzyme S subunit